MRASGLKVLRVFLLSTEGMGAVAACASTPVPDVEPITVGVFNDTILQRLDDLLYEAALRGIKVRMCSFDMTNLSRRYAYSQNFSRDVIILDVH